MFILSFKADQQIRAVLSNVVVFYDNNTCKLAHISIYIIFAYIQVGIATVIGEIRRTTRRVQREKKTIFLPRRRQSIYIAISAFTKTSLNRALSTCFDIGCARHRRDRNNNVGIRAYTRVRTYYTYTRAQPIDYRREKRLLSVERPPRYRCKTDCMQWARSQKRIKKKK